MDKRCEMCGGVIRIDDWYSYISTKYCPACKKLARRIKENNRMRELRRKRREANALARELCASQQREIELLRAELTRQRERNHELESIVYGEADES